jgi:hypothetical protein
MIINTIEEFITAIPTASGTDWNTILPYLKQAEDEIKLTLTGEDLYAIVESEFKYKLASIVAHHAYRNAIPFVDLIQTPNGFGVVSNNNIAPASKERVERLLNQIDIIIDNSTDRLVELIINTDAYLTQWKKFRNFEALTSCVFNTGIDFFQYYNSDEPKKRSILSKYRNEIIAIQNTEIAEVISVDYMAEIIEKTRNNTLTAVDKQILYFVKTICVRLIPSVSKSESQADELIDRLSNYLDKNIGNYPTYAASQEYELKTVVKYKNQASDPTFFFGM